MNLQNVVSPEKVLEHQNQLDNDRSLTSTQRSTSKDVVQRGIDHYGSIENIRWIINKKVIDNKTYDQFKIHMNRYINEKKKI